MKQSMEQVLENQEKILYQNMLQVQVQYNEHHNDAGHTLVQDNDSFSVRNVETTSLFSADTEETTRVAFDFDWIIKQSAVYKRCANRRHRAHHTTDDELPEKSAKEVFEPLLVRSPNPHLVPNITEDIHEQAMDQNAESQTDVLGTSCPSYESSHSPLVTSQLPDAEVEIEKHYWDYQAETHQGSSETVSLSSTIRAGLPESPEVDLDLNNEIPRAVVDMQAAVESTNASQEVTVQAENVIPTRATHLSINANHIPQSDQSNQEDGTDESGQRDY